MSSPTRARTRRFQILYPRKGKIAKPTEFGKLVTIQESEHQVITAYEVHDRRPADMHGDLLEQAGRRIGISAK